MHRIIDDLCVFVLHQLIGIMLFLSELMTDPYFTKNNVDWVKLQNDHGRATTAPFKQVKAEKALEKEIFASVKSPKTFKDYIQKEELRIPEEMKALFVPVLTSTT